MAVKIRLARRGRKKQPFYHVVIADARAPRDGKFIEKIGSYNPMTSPATIEIDRDKAFDWLKNGAQPTDTVRAMLRFKGVYYRRHLMRGVAKGAMTEEKAMEMYHAWIDAKEAKIAARFEETRLKKEQFYKELSGEIKKVTKVAVAAETQEAFRETAGEEGAAEEASAEAPVVEATAEATPAVEAPVAEAKAEEEE